MSATIPVTPELLAAFRPVVVELLKELRAQEPIPRVALTYQEAADATGLSYDAIRALVKVKTIPTVPNLPCRIPADFIEKMMRKEARA